MRVGGLVRHPTRDATEVVRAVTSFDAVRTLITAAVHRRTGWPIPSKLPSLSLNQALRSPTPTYLS